jgi:serine protease inhibitor
MAMRHTHTKRLYWLLWLVAAGTGAPLGSQPPKPTSQGANAMADSGADTRSSWPAVGSVAAYPGFSLALVRAVAQHAPDSNVFLSPASAAFVLAMTAAGAAGSTWTGMAHVLGADTVQQAALGPANGDELSSLAKQSGVELDIANSIWASANRPILPSFLDESRRWYDAQVTSLVLHGAEAERRINAWVAQATKGKIPGILGDTLPDVTAMVLVNAVYFKGAWRGVFDTAQTKPHPFTLADGSTTSRLLMSRRSTLLYGRDTGMQIVRLPYRGGRIAMYVILPDSLAPTTAVIARLDTAHWGHWMRGMQSHDVHVLLPKFRLTTGESLRSPLEAMGMGIAFDRGRADFSRILRRSAVADSNVYVSDVLQRTYLEVNEQGTVAAAATGVTVAIAATAVRPPPIQFVVDRPFWVVIRDDRTGLILFMGHVVNPESD